MAKQLSFEFHDVLEAPSPRDEDRIGYAPLPTGRGVNPLSPKVPLKRNQGQSRKRAYTPQQAQAIETNDVSIALTAGAGCGKTFVLTERFVRFLQPGSSLNFSNIVAITFTDKATQEMRLRIREHCTERLQTCSEMDRPHWTQVLREIDLAQISTIHSFCLQFLKKHAVVAGLDPNFEIISKGINGVLSKRRIKNILNDLLNKDDPDLMALSVHLGLRQVEEIIEYLINRIHPDESARFGKLDVEELLRIWSEYRQTTFIPTLFKSEVLNSPFIRRLKMIQKTPPEGDLAKDRWGKIKLYLERLENGEHRLDLLKDLSEQTKVIGISRDKFTNLDYETTKDLFGKIRESIKDWGNTLALEGSEDEGFAAENCLRIARIARRVQSRYDELINKEGLLTYDDILTRTRDLLKMDRNFTRTVTGSIKALLIDEMQDTDPVQAEIVELLSGSEMARGKLFMVGDIQQSIYRFRNADPQVFGDLRERIPERGQLDLTLNFRSQPEILRFVNALFAGTSPDFRELLPTTEQLTQAPSIEFLFERSHVENADDGRGEEAKGIARRIQGLLTDQVPRVRDSRTGKLRPVAQGDIALLFRSFTNVHLYEQELRNTGLDYYTSGGRAFFAQQEVYDLVNFCRYLSNPRDEIALLGILRSPFFSLSEETLFSISAPGESFATRFEVFPSISQENNQARNIFSELPQYLLLISAWEILNQLRREKDRLSISQLLRRILELTGYDASLLFEHLGERKLANLEKLIEIAREFEKNEVVTLSDFASRLEETIKEEAHEALAGLQGETEDVIRLLTIHSAKGLEFPVVFVVDFFSSTQARKPTIAWHPQLGPVARLRKHQLDEVEYLAEEINHVGEIRMEKAETLRILYVALTRAADHLVLSGVEPKNRYNHKSSYWFQLLKDRYDTKEGTPLENVIGYDGQLVNSHFFQDAPRAQILALGSKDRIARPPQEKKTLEDLRKRVYAAKPALLPSLMAPIPKNPRGLLRLSVSEIEQYVPQKRNQANASVLGNYEIARNSAETRVQGAEQSQSALIGNLAHSVIEQLPIGKTEKQPDWSELVHKLCWREQGVYGDEVCAATERLIGKLVTSKLFEELRLCKKIERELQFSLLWPIGDSPLALIQGKIDLFGQDKNGKWFIWDFKTGHSAKGVLPYRTQLAIYGWAMKEWLGEWPDRMEIIWLEGVERTAFVPTSNQLDATELEITSAIHQRIAELLR